MSEESRRSLSGVDGPGVETWRKLQRGKDETISSTAVQIVIAGCSVAWRCVSQHGAEV